MREMIFRFAQATGKSSLYLFCVVGITLWLQFAIGLVRVNSGYGLGRLMLPGILSETCIAIGALGGLVIVGFQNPREALRSAGFRWTDGISSLLIGYAIGMAYVWTWGRCVQALGYAKFVAEQQAPHALQLFVYTSLIGFAEEIVFRGFFFRNIERSYGTSLAVIISSAAFGMSHWLVRPNPNVIVHTVDCLIFGLSSGSVLAGVYLLRRNIWMAIAVHAAWDFLSSMTMYPDTYGGASHIVAYHAPILRYHFAFGHTGNWTLIFARGGSIDLVFYAWGFVFGLLLLTMARKRGQWRTVPRRKQEPALPAPTAVGL